MKTTKQITKQIFVFGTISLSDCPSILVYNSNTFFDEHIVNVLNLSKSDLDLLRSPIASNNVIQIFTRLHDFEEFSTLTKTKNNNFVFNNNKFNCINGQGFNTIIFIDEFGNVVGYIELLKTIGYNYSTEATEYNLKKNYLVNYINISIDSKNTVICDKNNINIVNNIIESDRELPYLKKKDLSNIYISLYKNYNKNILDNILHSKECDTITNNTFIKKNESSNSDQVTFNVFKVNLLKNIKLPNEYEQLTNYQIGYYKGDISLFMWNELGQYSIISLTKQEDLGSTKIPVSYTYPRLNSKNNQEISKTNVYQLPGLNGNQLKIEYFSGRYIVCKGENNERYLFDIELQSGNGVEPNAGWIHIKKSTGNYLNYNKINNKWVLDRSCKIISTTNKFYSSIDFIPNNIDQATVEEKINIYVRYFLLDVLDIRNKITFSEKNWQTYKESIKDCPELSNLYLDTEKLINSGAYPYKKVGSWIIFNTSDGLYKIYSTDTKVIKLSVKEPEPLIVNDQILIVKDKDVFTIYDENGYYITRAASELSRNNTSLASDEIFNNSYKLINPEEHPEKIFKLSEKDSPILLQKSFFKYFRRNELPDSLSNLEIIGSFEGFIFYKINKNIINYL